MFQRVTRLWLQKRETQHLVVQNITFNSMMFTTCSYAIFLDTDFLDPSDNNIGENLNILPYFIKTFEAGFIYQEFI
jgi:hypothetical protein